MKTGRFRIPRLVMLVLLVVASLISASPARADYIIEDEMKFAKELSLSLRQTMATHTWSISPLDLIDSVEASSYARIGGILNIADTMSINPSGVGINCSPEFLLHIKDFASSEQLARFQVGDSATARLDFTNGTTIAGAFIPRVQSRSTSTNAGLIMEGVSTLDTGGNPVIVVNAGKSSGGGLVTRPLVIFRNNSAAKVTILANGGLKATSFNPVSSRALKENIVTLDADRALEALRHLTPVKFAYRDDPGTQHLGFIAEDVPELVAEADRQSVPVMDVAALLTRIVKDHQVQIDSQVLAISTAARTIQSRQTEIESRKQVVFSQRDALARQKKIGLEQQKMIDALQRRIADLEQHVP